MHNTYVCGHTYFLNIVRYSVECHNNVIIVDKKDKTVINNQHTIKQNKILMCVHTYFLNR